MRRISLGALALAGALAGGAGIASTAASAAAAKPMKVTCKAVVAQQIPTGTTAVDPSATSGTYLGTAGCGKATGAGAAAFAFTVAGSGDLKGAWKFYFDGGTMRGKFVLTPTTDQAPTPEAFAAETLAGTLTVTGGSGAYAGARGAGKVNCTSSDSIHLRCVEHLKLARL